MGSVSRFPLPSPGPCRRSLGRPPDRGQASAEYVVLLLVVALALGAGAVALVPGVAPRVLAAMRTGICIVGGDVCRPADAAAAGLEPCVVRERFRRQDTALDVAVVRLGGHGEWQLAARSDGSALVARLADDEVGGTVGVGVSFSPAGIDASLDGVLTVDYHGGRAWRFGDVRAAARFLAAASHDGAAADARPPDVRWHALGSGVDVAASAGFARLARAGLSASATSAVGLRTEGDRRTLTLDAMLGAPAPTVELPGFPGAAAGPARGAAIDLTWEGDEPRELTLRAAVDRGDRVEESTARLDLRDAGNRAAARAALGHGLSPAGMRSLTRRLARHGTIDRMTYAVAEDRDGFEIAARLGAAVGLAHARVTGERRLLDAVSWVKGGPAQRRFDCLGV